MSLRFLSPVARRALHALAIGFLLWPTAVLAGPRPDTVMVSVDQAKLVKLPSGVATIVVGNPLIADATLQTGGILVVTGKGYGVTNVIALDRAGTVLMEKLVEVKGPGADAMIVYRGIERETYSCTPICERRITPGDTGAYFDAAINQTGNRNDRAQGVQPGK